MLFGYIHTEDKEKFVEEVNNTEDLNVTDEAGLTPLHLACDRGLTSFIEILLEKGVNVNPQDNDGSTPLMLAAICDRPEIVKLLLSHGADKSLKDNSGESVLDMDLSSEVKALLQ